MFQTRQQTCYNKKYSNQAFLNIIKSCVRYINTVQVVRETSSESARSPLDGPGPAGGAAAARGQRGARSVAVRRARGGGQGAGRGGASSGSWRGLCDLNHGCRSLITL